jgi:hypothetical protein
MWDKRSHGVSVHTLIKDKDFNSIITIVALEKAALHILNLLNGYERVSQLKAKHDSDGKIFFERDGKVVWLCEVPIDDGDAVAKAMNRFAEECARESKCSGCGKKSDQLFCKQCATPTA